MSKDILNSNFAIKTKHLWHSSGIYCLTFDRTGDFIITGGDDGIVKIFSIVDEKLVKTLTDGSENVYKTEIEIVCKSLAVDELKTLEKKMESFAISDIVVNHENTLISAGKQNGLILVWNLQTGDLIAKLDKHGFPIISLTFSPLTIDSNGYLISTSNDGFMFFWKYEKKTNIFTNEPEFRRTKYDNCRAQNMCYCSSSGGLLIGLIHTFEVENKGPSKPMSKKDIENHFQCAIRIFSFNDDSGPLEVWKTTHFKSHEDCEYSLRFAKSGFRFASGCNKDSNASVWSFDKPNKKWDQIIIDTNKKDNKKVLRVRGKKSITSDDVFVDEIIWSSGDTYVITSLSDFSVKVWKSVSGELVRHYDKNHEKAICTLESHPIHDYIFLSGGFDGKLFIYNINKGTILTKFECSLNLNNLCTNEVIDKKFKELANNKIIIEEFNELTIDEINPHLKPMLLMSQFSPNGLNIGLADNFGNLNKFSIEREKEVDILAQLEQSLERIHGETDEEDEKVEVIPSVMPSDEEYLNVIENQYEYEIGLLRATSFRLSQSSDSIKSQDIKAVNNSSFKKPADKKSIKTAADEKEIKAKITKSVEKEITTKITKSVEKEITTKITKSDDKDYNNSENESDSGDDKFSPKEKTNQIQDLSKGKSTKSALRTVLNAIFANPNSKPFQIVDHIEYPTYRKDISNADLTLSSISEDLNTEGRYSITRFRNDMNGVFENAKEFFEDRNERILQMAIDLEEFFENQMDAMFGDMWKHTNKKSSVKVNKQNGDQNGVVSVVEESEAKVVEKNSKTEDKQIQNKKLKTKPQIKAKQIIPKSQMKTRKSETLEAKAVVLETEMKTETKNELKVETNSEKKRKSGPRLSPAKRAKLSTNKTTIPVEIESESMDNSVPPSVDDIEHNPMISEVIKEKIIIEKNNNLNSLEKKLNVNLERINLDPTPTDPITIIDIEESESSDDSNDVIEIDHQLSDTSNAVPYRKSSVNGLKTRNDVKSDNKNDLKLFKGKPYFCIFCDQLFDSKSDASSHYVMHLCPLTCRECDQKFASYDKFITHNSEHSKSIEWCQHYRDSNVWINNFLVFQQKEDNEPLFYQKCIVCQRIQDLKPRNNTKTSAVKNVTLNHLKDHLKYDPKYVCLICFLNEDESFECDNLDKAKEHLSSDHNIDDIDDPLIHFDSKIPKLEAILRK